MLSLAISAFHAWWTLFRRGTIRMTRPTFIYFGHDGPFRQGEQVKVTLGMLLYSTAQRGQVIESMYVRLRHEDVNQDFSIWVHGDGPLTRGSGLYLGQEGIKCAHHFLPSAQMRTYKFCLGHYTVEVWGTAVNRKRALLLSRTNLILGEEEAQAIEQRNGGVYFDWEPGLMKYQSHIEEKPEEDEILRRLISRIA